MRTLRRIVFSMIAGSALLFAAPSIDASAQSQLYEFHDWILIEFCSGDCGSSALCCEVVPNPG